MQELPKLKPYQVRVAQEVLEKKRVLIADDMGLGKTAEAIATKIALDLQNVKGSALVVAPPSVLPHWEREIRKWYSKGINTSITRVNTSSHQKDLTDSRGSDFVLVSYPTLSHLGDSSSFINKLTNLECSLGIIDEVHNAKNPHSLRSTAVRNIFHNIPYLTLLSGTPMPNSIVDLYAVLNLLDKDAFPINSANVSEAFREFYSLFKREPNIVKRFLHGQMLRRKAPDFLTSTFPRLNQHILEVRLEGEHRDIYVEVYNNDTIRPAQKLIELRKVAIDPSLANPTLISSRSSSRIKRAESEVYKSLDAKLQEIVDSNGKAVIFSDLKTGVVDKLRQRYNHFGAISIDGDTENGENLNQREELRKRFQEDPNVHVLVVTGVMDEGVDLTAATDNIHLTLPYNPGVFDQRNHRSQRIGEIKKSEVNSYIVRPIIDLMIPTVSEGIEKLIEDKRRIFTCIIEDPLKISKEDLNEAKNGDNVSSRNIIPTITSPSKLILGHLRDLRGIGHVDLQKHYAKHVAEAEFFARVYAENWEGSYGGNTANLIREAIRVLESRNSLDDKLDIACGPFSLSRRLREPVNNLDINPHMINAGRKLEEAGVVPRGNKAQQGCFHNLPFDTESFDLANCSLALHMAKPEVKVEGRSIMERATALKEMNRVLRYGGYAVLSLPHTVIAGYDLPRFYDGLENLGFTVLPYSGFYKGKDSNFRVYLGMLQKTGKPSDTFDAENFMWRMDRKLQITSGRSVEKTKPCVKERNTELKKEVVGEFYHTQYKKTLTEIE